MEFAGFSVWGPVAGMGLESRSGWMYYTVLQFLVNAESLHEVQLHQNDWKNKGICLFLCLGSVAGMELWGPQEIRNGWMYYTVLQFWVNAESLHEVQLHQNDWKKQRNLSVSLFGVCGWDGALEILRNPQWLTGLHWPTLAYTGFGPHWPTLAYAAPAGWLTCARLPCCDGSPLLSKGIPLFSKRISHLKSKY